MNYRNKKRLQIINYIVSKLIPEKGIYRKEMIIKLIYLADKFFLLKYGCTMTSDKLLAFERGTACSGTLAIMDLNKDIVEDNDEKVLKTFANTYKIIPTQNTKNVYGLKIKNKLNPNISTLSKREIEAIDIIMQNFGDKSYEELSQYTHKFKEWEVFKKNFPKECSNKCCGLNIKDIFEDKTFLEHEELKKYLSEERIQISTRIYNGEF